MPSYKESHAKKPNPGHGIHTSFGKDLETIDISKGLKSSNNASQGTDHAPGKHGGSKGTGDSQYKERGGR